MKRVLCVGLLCIDVVSYIDSYPAEDTDSNCKDQIWTTGGNATNISKVLKQLGIDSTLYASLGNALDLSSKLAINELSAYGVNLDHCEYRADQMMPTSNIWVNTKTGSRTILHCKRNMTEPKFNEFREKFTNSGTIKDDAPPLADFAAIYIEGRNVDETNCIIGEITKWKNSVAVNSGCHTPWIIVEVEKPGLKIDVSIAGVDIAVISKDYAGNLSLHSMNEAALYFRRTFDQMGLTDVHIVCPWGKNGACLLTKDNQLYESPSFDFRRMNDHGTQFLDTLGAGDTFIAAFIKSLVDALPLQESLKNACKVAGLKCSFKGYRFPPNFDVFLNGQC